MSFRETLFTRMTSGHAGLSALIGTRAYPVALRQQDTLPAIRYNLITTITPPLMGSDAGLKDYTYQFDIYGSTAQVDAVIVQLRSALVRWRPGDGVPQDSFVINESDLYEEDLNLYGARIDIRFIVEE